MKKEGRSHLHEQGHSLRKGRNRLLGLLDGPHMLHTILSIPNPFLDLAYRAELSVSIPFNTKNGMVCVASAVYYLSSL